MRGKPNGEGKKTVLDLHQLVEETSRRTRKDEVKKKKEVKRVKKKKERKKKRLW